ncbi:MAG TPA: sigma-70 family RNA polymerase sigma factor [Stellaceae bacterium]|nr:sigma-70 family RNA polymerase sigma factor [Stellaceae bacterium]
MQATVIDVPFTTASRRAPAIRRNGIPTRQPLDPVIAAQHRALMAAVAGRDTGAFMALFNYYAPRLKAYMKKLGTSDELAEELAQDVMVVVWRKAETYDPAKSAVSSWLFTIARNLRIDALRRDLRKAFDVTDPTLLPAPLPAPDHNLQTSDQQREMRQVLGTLPQDQAEVVTLAFYHGKSHGEIAAALAIPLGTVKSRMRLAFQRIREALEAASGAPKQALKRERAAA